MSKNRNENKDSEKFKLTAKVQPYMSIEPGFVESKRINLNNKGKDNTDRACEDLFEESNDGDRKSKRKASRADNETVA